MQVLSFLNENLRIKVFPELDLLRKELIMVRIIIQYCIAGGFRIGKKYKTFDKKTKDIIKEKRKLSKE